MRRRQSIRFWSFTACMVLACAAAYAWRVGWLPIDFADAPTGVVLNVSGPAAGDETQSTDAESFMGPDEYRDVFEEQEEPVAPPAPPARPGARQPEVSFDEFAAGFGAAPENADAFPLAGAEPTDAVTRPLPAATTAAGSLSAAALPNPSPPTLQTAQVDTQLDTQPNTRLDTQSQTVSERPVDSAGVGGEATAELSAADQALLAQIDQWLEQGDELRAHRELSKLYWERTELRGTIRKRIEGTAYSIYSAPQPHYLKPYVVQPGDQLRVIARRYDVPWEYLAGLNRVDPRKIRPGQKLKVIKGPFAAVVDLGDFALTVHAHGYFVRRYPVGIGKDGASPIGKFQVQEKLVNPTYYGPDGVIAADNPDNPLGERWIGIGDSYGIHGTIEPDSIGKAESKGCIRMHAEHVVEVYDLLSVGSEIIIRR